MLGPLSYNRSLYIHSGSTARQERQMCSILTYTPAALTMRAVLLTPDDYYANMTGSTLLVTNLFTSNFGIPFIAW